MKIGILTHHYIDNFGAFLQTWALCKTVQQLCPDADVKVIDHVCFKHHMINTGGFFRYYRKRETLGLWLEKLRLPRIYRETRKQFLPLSQSVHNAAEINQLGFDTIIVGSDEVWNHLDRKSYSPVKYGIGLQVARLIAYAPSAGRSSDVPFPAELAEGLKHFSHLSARDGYTAALTRLATGKTVAQVLDPTFLTPIPADCTAKVNRLIQEPFLLFYGCDAMPPAMRMSIVDAAHREGLRILGAGEGHKDNDAVSTALTPFEWAALFEHAAYIVTGTFHGVVFSLLNRKSFRTWVSIPSRIKKVDALLSEFGIPSRELTDSRPFSLQDTIDYSSLDPLIEQKRNDSTAWLKAALEQQ